jgi:AcrR family transcriptional regulator
MTPRRARILAGEPDRGVREHLLEATVGLLAESGVEHLTTRRIARAAGVADGVLYNHFANKDELILTALTARVSMLMGVFREACPTAGTATVEANLERLAAALLELQRGLLPLLVGLIGKRALLERFLVSIHAPEIGGADAIIGCVHEYLDGEQRLGRLGSTSDAHVAGVLFLAITQMQALVTHVRAADTTDAEAARELQPFIRFLAETLTAGSAKPRQQTTKGRKR